jgi:hypothetical protein
MKLADGGFWPIASGNLAPPTRDYWAKRDVHTSVV